MIRRLVSKASLVRGFASVDPTKNYYKEMEIEESASAIDIKKAYVKLVKKYHPDQNKGN